MKKIIHKSEDRGYADHGWLQSRHSFSFADYYDENKIHFGKLRVLNDDIVAPGKGFDLHPHRDMEIISIPLEGNLRHGDSMGNTEIISSGEVQVMTAGTGIYHSEFNASEIEQVKFLQIWIFPDKKGYKPGYDQQKFLFSERQEKFQLLVSPDGREGSLIIKQDAFLSIIETLQGNSFQYSQFNITSGVYFFLIEGKAFSDEFILDRRDAIGIYEAEGLITIGLTPGSKLLAIEVPMN